MTKNSLTKALSFRQSGRRRAAPQDTPGLPVDKEMSAELKSAIAGDRDAVESVLRWIRPLVVRYCRARVGGQEKAFASADDVAQEVCLAVFAALPGYRDQGRPFLAFVYGIAAHKVADAHRSAARNRAEPVPEIPDSPTLTDGPEQQAMQGELAGRMNKLLDILPDKQREILTLRVVVGLSAEETAEAVGSTPGAVRVAQHRALSRLRSKLATDNDQAHRIQQHIAVTKTTEDDLVEVAEELDILLADADRALRRDLRAPVVISSKLCGVESIDDEYIEELLRVADAHLRQKLGMGDADRFELT